MIHPDTFYEHNRMYQSERRIQSARPLPEQRPSANSYSFRSRFFLWSGARLIGLGQRLQGQARTPYGDPQIVR